MIAMDELRERVRCLPLVRGIDQLAKGPIRIETGLLYPDGDSIDIFLVEEGSLLPTIRLSDLGQTMTWLLNAQVKPWLSKNRKAQLEDILRLYGVKQNGGALEVPLESANDIPEALLKLGQACLRVADLMFTRRLALQSSFVEEVEEVLVDAELFYEANFSLPGRFSEPVRIDFVVYAARKTSAVLVLSTGNSSQAHVLANEIFRKWYDLSVPDRTEQKVTLFDDLKDIYRDDDLNRLQDMSVLVPFSNRHLVRETFAA